jgi:hypothetical protein
VAKRFVADVLLNGLPYGLNGLLMPFGAKGLPLPNALLLESGS